jgi:uncharacterized protein YceK
MRTVMTVISLFMVLSVLSGCGTLGTNTRLFWEGFSGHSQSFITNHSEQYRIVGDRVYPAWNTTRER